MPPRIDSLARSLPNPIHLPVQVRNSSAASIRVKQSPFQKPKTAKPARILKALNHKDAESHKALRRPSNTTTISKLTDANTNADEQAPSANTAEDVTNESTEAPIRAPLSIPPYPYASPQWYKQQLNGLYGGTKVQFGNKVSDKNEIKTRRTWHPNLKNKWLYSDGLGRKIRLKVTTRVLRTIDKVGGLDNYLLGNDPARVKELGEYGWSLRWCVLYAPRMKERLESDATLRRVMEGDRKLAAMSAVEREKMKPKEPVRESESVDEDEEYEEEDYMHEEPPPPASERRGILGRLGDTVTAPFRWRRAA